MQVTGRSVLYSVLFLLIYFVQPVLAQKYPDTKVDNLLRSGIESIIRQNYAEAEQRFQRLHDNYPDLPLGNIYLSAVKIASSIDLGTEFDENFIISRLENAENMSEQLIKKHKNSLWNYYFAALAKGYLAYYKALKRDYIPAFSNGVTSMNLFEQCLNMDSTFFESYIAIGTYKYWRSEKTQFLKWLPFMSDERDIGIRYLKRAVENLTYNYYLAENSLIWIYINKKEYGKAAAEAEKILKKYPDSRVFKLAYARAFQQINKKKAISIYKEVLDSYTPAQLGNHYNEIVLKHKIAMLYHEIGDDWHAQQLCREILAINSIQDKIKEKLDNRLERVKKLNQELLKN